MGLNAMCKLNPDSAACNLWQREVCGQCPKWYLNQDHGRIIRSNSKNPAYKMITNEECQRLKRELELSFVLPTGWPNSLVFIILVLFILLCMGITVYLLARAFIFQKKSDLPSLRKPDDSAEREAGGTASVEHIVQQLRDKCNPSADKVAKSSNQEESLYVPQHFWDKFPLIGNQRTEEQNTEGETSDTSEESSESSESTESSCVEEANENEEGGKASSATSGDTTGTTEEQSQQTTDDEEPVNDNYEQIARKSNNSLADMPATYYGHSQLGQTNHPSRGKIRWANWLRRGNPTDFQV